MSELLILTGQSNQLGFGVTPDTLPDYATTNPQIQIFNRQSQSFEAMVPGVNTNNKSNFWGPEVQYAHQWAKDHPGETLYIVKSVEGSTGLAQDANAPDWSPSSVGDVFDKTTARVLAAKDLIGSIDKVTLIHAQGEEDATSAAKAGAYLDNLTAFVGAARVEWGFPDMQVVIAQIQGPGLPFSAEVRAAQEAFTASDAHSALVTTDGFALQDDNLHLNAQGQLDQGAAFYAATNALEVATNGTAGEDLIAGSVGNDTLFGGMGNDQVHGGAGFDRINGNQGDDWVWSGAGDDWTNGGQGNDRLFGEAGNDVLQGDLGADTLSGGAGADCLFGNGGADVLVGGAGLDTLRGGQDGDQLDGGEGNDWLSGDLGNDTLTGGSGADVFHFSTGAGSDLVTDFDFMAGDRIQLDQGVAYTLTASAAGTVLAFDGASIILAGVAVDDSAIFFLTA